MTEEKDVYIEQVLILKNESNSWNKKIDGFQHFYATYCISFQFFGIVWWHKIERLTF